MKNKHGFTLIELLAVIVLLGLLMAIAIPSVIAVSRRMQTNMYCTKIESLENSAKLYAQDYGTSNIYDASASGKNEPNYSDITSSITVQDLLDEGYVKKDDIDDTNQGLILDPRDNSTSMNNVEIKIFQKYKRAYAKIIEAITTCD